MRQIEREASTFAEIVEDGVAASSQITRGDADVNEHTDHMILLRRALLTTTTKASDDNESDPDDEPDAQLIAMHALLTTLTESSGDNESDPEDDESRPNVVCGQSRPLAYRFAEPGLSGGPPMKYDTERQLHVLSDGTPIVDVLGRQRRGAG